MKLEKVKAAAAAMFGALSSWLGILAIPMYVLVLMNLADYFTGIAASKYRGERVSSYRGMRGIVKKVCMWLLVGVGAVMDWLLMYASQAAGLSVGFAFPVASVTAVWLICNEVISVLENMDSIGIALPPFLKKLAESVRDSGGEKLEK